MYAYERLLGHIVLHTAHTRRLEFVMPSDIINGKRVIIERHGEPVFFRHRMQSQISGIRAEC